MRLALALAFVTLALVACTHPAPPVTPTVTTARQNLACQQARMVDKNSMCIPLRTGEAGLPDLAWADAGDGYMLRCVAGEGMGAKCSVFADLAPKPEPKPEAPKADAPPPPAPAPPAGPSSPPPTPPAAGEAKKPDPPKAAPKAGAK